MCTVHKVLILTQNNQLYQLVVVYFFKVAHSTETIIGICKNSTINKYINLYTLIFSKHTTTQTYMAYELQSRHVRV